MGDFWPEPEAFSLKQRAWQIKNKHDTSAAGHPYKLMFELR